MKRLFLLFFFKLISFYITDNINSQEIEPRNYANVPKGVNVAALSYAYSYGNVVTDATSIVQDLKISSNSIIGTYVHTFGLFGKLSKLQVNIPYAFLSGSGKLNGRDTSVSRSGIADTRLKFSINLIGSPALTPRDFPTYKEKLIIGTSVVIAIPTGQYLTDKLINIGSNRWGFKPEIGMSKRLGPWYTELYTGIWFFTENNEYLKVNKLKQDPIFSFQGHLCYTFPSQMWIALNGAYADGGETKVNGVFRNDFQKNFRVGATLSYPITREQSLKLIAHTGTSTRAGQNFSIITLTYQYTWIQNLFTGF